MMPYNGQVGREAGKEGGRKGGHMIRGMCFRKEGMRWKDRSSPCSCSRNDAQPFRPLSLSCRRHGDMELVSILLPAQAGARVMVWALVWGGGLHEEQWQGRRGGGRGVWLGRGREGSHWKEHIHRSVRDPPL